MDMQNLINSGTAWALEGSVGRQCMGAIESGMCILGEDGHKDYWGNYVPSRYEVKADTKGSVQYANRIRKQYGLKPLRGIDFDAGKGYDLEQEIYDYEGVM
jgi:hypothetical protein